MTGSKDQRPGQGPRAGEFARNARIAKSSEDSIRGRILAIGRDKWLAALTSDVGEERALAAASQYGINTSEYLAGRARLQRRVQQASVSYDNPPPKRDPNQKS